MSLFKWCRQGLPEEVPQLQQVGEWSDVLFLGGAGGKKGAGAQGQIVSNGCPPPASQAESLLPYPTLLAQDQRCFAAGAASLPHPTFFMPTCSACLPAACLFTPSPARPVHPTPTSPHPHPHPPTGPQVLKLESSKPRPVRGLTVVTQLSLERFQMLENQCSTWPLQVWCGWVCGGVWRVGGGGLPKRSMLEKQCSTWPEQVWCGQGYVWVGVQS